MKQNNTSVFPQTGLDSDDDVVSLRDYFAAKAMQAYIVNGGIESRLEYIAFDAYLVADAMLEERKK